MEDRIGNANAYPFSLPTFRHGLELKLSCPVTIFVGENGTGKSTLLEALVYLAGLPIGGGGRNEVGLSGELEQTSLLGQALRPKFLAKPSDGYFFRAESQERFSDILDDRNADPWFDGNPYARYGGRPLTEQSHGEGFLSIVKGSLRSGLYFLDEPESALSTKSQVYLGRLIQEAVKKGAQIVLATHSPVLMSLPGADILEFTDSGLRAARFQETEHFQMLSSLLRNPHNFWAKS